MSGTGSIGGPSRGRTALATTAALVLVLAAGCAGLPGLGGGGGGPPPAPDQVPAGADYVVTVHVSELRSDDAVRRVLNASLSGGSADVGSTTTAGALDEFENETDLDGRKLTDVVVFGRYPPEDAPPESPDYAGFVLTTDWSESDLVTAIETDAQGSVSESTYGGKTLYELPTDAGGDASYLGVLADGRFVVGTRAAVTDAIDVETDEADALDGDLRDRYEATREDGYVRFAAAVPQDRVPAGQVGGRLDTEVFNDVTTVAGSQYADDGDVGANVTLTFASESAASDATNVIDGAVSLYSGMLPDDRTEVKAVLDGVTTTRDGTAVTVSTEASADTWTALLERLNGPSAGRSL
ncbi:MAG: hypothetical protein ABEJ70_02055 [Halobacteriaceae archaeon]